MAKIFTHMVDGNKVEADKALRLEQLGFHAHPIPHEICLEASDYLGPEVIAEPCNQAQDS